MAKDVKATRPVVDYVAAKQLAAAILERPQPKPGDLADQILTLDKLRAQLDKASEAASARVLELERELSGKMVKLKLGNAGGRRARAEFVEKEFGRVDNWEVFYAYIAKTKAFDLLQRRPNNKALAERWDAKKKVPGVIRDRVKLLKISAKKV